MCHCNQMRVLTVKQFNKCITKQEHKDWEKTVKFQLKRFRMKWSTKFLRKSINKIMFYSVAFWLISFKKPFTSLQILCFLERRQGMNSRILKRRLREEPCNLLLYYFKREKGHKKCPNFLFPSWQSVSRVDILDYLVFHTSNSKSMFKFYWFLPPSAT